MNDVCSCCKGAVLHFGDATQWVCHPLNACGARGYYEQNLPVAKENDASRLSNMCARLIDAIVKSSNRDRVKCLSAHVTAMYAWLGSAWFERDNGKSLWLYEYRRFEENLKDADAALRAALRMKVDLVEEFFDDKPDEQCGVSGRISIHTTGSGIHWTIFCSGSGQSAFSIESSKAIKAPEDAKLDAMNVAKTLGISIDGHPYIIS